MEDTIELREIIETIWRGKWLIAIITALFVLASVILSYFILPEKFESKATLLVASEVQDAGIMSSYVSAEFTPSIFAKKIKNEALMSGAFDNAGILGEFNLDNLKLSIQPNSSLVDITYISNDAQIAHDYLSMFIAITKERMNESVKNTLNELEKTYTSEAEQLSNEIKTIIEQYNNLIVKNDLPKVLIMQTLMNSQIITNITNEQTDALVKVDGFLHNELMQMQAQIASKSAEYRNVLDKYQSVKTGLDSFRPDPYIRTIIEPTIPENPSAPRKLLNVAIGMIIGLMLGFGLVFFREYWKNTSPEK